MNSHLHRGASDRGMRHAGQSVDRLRGRAPHQRVKSGDGGLAQWERAERGGADLVEDGGGSSLLLQLLPLSGSLLVVLESIFSGTVDCPNDQLLRLDVLLRSDMLKKSRVRMLREHGGEGGGAGCS